MKLSVKLCTSLILLSIFFVGVFSLNPGFIYAPKDITVAADDQIKETIEQENEKSVSQEVYDTQEKDGSEIEVNPDTQEILDENQKIAYLTFDDGPSPEVTPQILDILKEYDIKATFFIIGSQAEKNPDLILQIKNEGHVIANHSYGHDYKYLYSNTNNFLSDIKKTEEILKSILADDFDSSLIRFPGGSHGDSKAAARRAAKANGYKYVDWNVVNGDAEGMYIPAPKLLNRVQQTLKNQKEAIVLMHDGKTKQTSADALPDIIDYLKSQDYIFRSLETYDFD